MPLRQRHVSLKALALGGIKSNDSSAHRRFDRLDIELPVSLCCKNYMIREAATTANISAGGAFLYTENYALDNDERVCLEVQTHAGKKLCLMGTVIWSNLFPVDAAPQGKKGVGVRFQTSDDPQIKQWMQSLGIAATY